MDIYFGTGSGRLVCIAKEDPPKWGGTFGRRGLVCITKPGVLQYMCNTGVILVDNAA